jgi:hypothetical protein
LIRLRTQKYFAQIAKDKDYLKSRLPKPPNDIRQIQLVSHFCEVFRGAKFLNTFLSETLSVYKKIATRKVNNG